MATGTWNNPNSEENLTVTFNTTDFTLESWGLVSAKKIGNIVYLRVQGFRSKNTIPSGQQKLLVTFSGNPAKGYVIAPIILNDGGIDGRGYIPNGTNDVYVSSISTANRISYFSLIFPV